MNLVTIMSTVCALFGACLSTLVAWQLVLRFLFVSNSVVVNGEIVGSAEVNVGGSTTHSPRIRFRTLTGREVSFKSGATGSLSSWKVGAPVKVRYQPEQADAAEIDSFMALWFAPCALGAIAMAFWFLGVGVVGGVFRM